MNEKYNTKEFWVPFLLIMAIGAVIISIILSRTNNGTFLENLGLSFGIDAVYSLLVFGIYRWRDKRYA